VGQSGLSGLGGGYLLLSGPVVPSWIIKFLAVPIGQIGLGSSRDHGLGEFEEPKRSPPLRTVCGTLRFRLLRQFMNHLISDRAHGMVETG
jgi:hypothetical protein